jgi:hypothetical protein
MRTTLHVRVMSCTQTELVFVSSSHLCLWGQCATDVGGESRLQCSRQRRQRTARHVHGQRQPAAKSGGHDAAELDVGAVRLWPLRRAASTHF